MIKAKVEWKGDEALRQIQAASFAGIQRAVVFLWQQVTQALAKSYPPASKPGEPPRKRTSWLQRNVQYELDPKSQTGRVGVTKNAMYGVYLEVGTSRVKARPFLLSTLKKVWSTLQQLASARS